MAGVAGMRCFRSSSRNCLLSNALRSNLGRSENRLTSVICHDYGRLWTAKRAYASGIETPDEKEDPKDKPIRFSTSKARYMTLNQTLGYGGEIERNSSKKSIYIGLIGMAIMTYIIFFLPADEEDELDLLDEVEIVAGQTKEK